MIGQKGCAAMSSYYHIVKKEILKEKQFLGIDYKFFYYFICLIGIVVVWNFFSFVNKQPNLENKDNSAIYIYLLLMAICYFLVKWLNKKMISFNLKSAWELRHNELLGENALECLVQEVEQSVKNIKRFAEWCVGIIVTLVVLVSTLMLNVYSKLADVILRGVTDEEIKVLSEEALKQINKPGYDPFSELFGLFFQLLFLFSSFILFGYFVFSLFSIVKRQVLVTLYDIRYAQLLPDEYSEKIKE